MASSEPAPVEFMSIEFRPVKVDVELNLDPLYFNMGDGPVTLRLLHNGIFEPYDALAGAEMLLNNIPDNLDIGPQQLMIKLVLNHMNSVLGNLIPSKSKSGRGYIYDRSTDPPSYQPYGEYLEKVRAEEKARQKNLSQIRKESANA